MSGTDFPAGLPEVQRRRHTSRRPAGSASGTLSTPTDRWNGIFMAFECGALGRSGDKTALESLTALLAHLVAEDADVSHGAISEGDGWAAGRIRISRPGEPVLEQYLQVSVRGEIVDSYLEDAREVLSDAQTQGRDLMVTMILSGPTDPISHDRIMAYALSEWQGIPWDETSGFSDPASEEPGATSDIACGRL
ncbi:hypothetical protein [Kitasatospora sp. NPDC059599]|uniref:hypothetical protein n=1 Tax=Kitasatospora sp. NPDC059599 TaxID=3346880 RepID=UPI0036839E0E